MKFLVWHWLLVFSPNYYPPVSEASREVANLTERKNQHTPVYGVKEFVCLSVTKIDCISREILHRGRLT